MLTLERLKEVLDYDPGTGIFRWRKSLGMRCRIGEIAGNKPVSSKKYGQIKIDGVIYKTHRLAWLYVHEVWPKDQIDHINCNKMDNRLANLREATNQQNVMNQGCRNDNVSGWKGVYWHKRCLKWCAQIGFDGKNLHIGYFETSELAYEARRREAQKLHGEFARDA